MTEASTGSVSDMGPDLVSWLANGSGGGTPAADPLLFTALAVARRDQLNGTRKLQRVASSAAAVSQPYGQPESALDSSSTETLRATLDLAATSFINGVINATFMVPGSNTGVEWLSGFLLKVRNNLYDLPPVVSNLQSASNDQVAQGSIALFDALGRVWTPTLLNSPDSSDPTYPTVTLSEATTTTTGTATTVDYSFSKDADPAWDPAKGGSFTVSFTAESRTVDPLTQFIRMLMGRSANPAGQTVEIVVDVPGGDGAGTAPLGASPFKTMDLTLQLPGATGTIVVGSQNPLDRISGLLTGRTPVALTMNNPGPDAYVNYQDGVGRSGSFTVAELVQKWDQISAKAAAGGGTPLLATVALDEQGNPFAGFMQVAKVAVNSNGDIVFTGSLTPNAPQKQNVVDTWDVTGIEYKAQYQNFLDRCTSNSCTVNFTGDLFATTFTPVTYKEYGGADSTQASPESFGTAAPAAGTQVVPGQPGPGGVAQAEAGNSSNPYVTAMVNNLYAYKGASLITGERDGTIKLWTAGVPTEVHGNSWGSAANVIMQYDRIVTNLKGETVPVKFAGSIEGNVLNVLTTDVGGGSTIRLGEEITGAGISPGTKITGFVSGLFEGAGTYTVNITQRVAVTSIEQKTNPLREPGFVVGLADGSVQYFNSKGCDNGGPECGWTELQDAGWNSPVNAMVLTDTGFAVGLKNGSVQEWTGSGFKETRAPASAGNLNVMMRTATGYVVGMSNGSSYGEVQKWDGTSWTQLKDNSWGGAGSVQTMIPFGSAVKANINGLTTTTTKRVCYKGIKCSDYTTTSPPEPDGTILYVTEHNGPALKVGQTLYGGPGVLEGTQIIGLLSGTGGVGTYLVNRLQQVEPGTLMTASNGDDGFVVGLANGSVQQCKDSCLTGSGAWTELMSPGWNKPVTTMIPYLDGFALGLGTSLDKKVKNQSAGAVMQWRGALTGNGFSELHDSGWIKPVTTLVQNGNGLVAGLGVSPNGKESGAVFRYDPQKNSDSPQNSWDQLYGPNWGSPVATMIPVAEYVTDELGNAVARESFILSMANKAIERWNGSNLAGEKADASFTELQKAIVNPVLQADTLRQTVTFASTGGQAMTVGDPLFQANPGLQAYCEPNCDGLGDYYRFTKVLDKTLYAVGDPKYVELSYVVNPTVYGYAFVPAGVINKFKPGKFSVGMVTAIETGPKMTVAKGTFVGNGFESVPLETVVNIQPLYEPTPYGVFAIDLGLRAGIAASLPGLNDGGANGLTAYAYYVPGMMFTWNTNGNSKHGTLSYAGYSDVDYQDFIDAFNGGLTITPVLEPYVTGSYGLFTPATTPLIGKFSVFSASLGYRNPIGLEMNIKPKDKPSLTLNSKGYITTSVGFFDSVSKKLTWENDFQLYDYKNKLFGPGGGSESL